MKTPSIILAALAAFAATTVSAQTASPSPDSASQTAPPSAVAASATPDWNMVSRSTTRAYLADVSSIAVNGDVTGVHLARVPLNTASPTDKHYTLVEMEFRCAAKQSRQVAEIDYDPTGAAQDRIESGEEFSDYHTDTLDAYLAAVACDGDRATPPTFPSIEAFIAAGRPAPKS